MNLKFAIVVSRFNESVTDKLLQGAYSQLIESGVDINNITIVNVPGAVEIPLIAQLLAKKNIYHAIICLGAVIRGDTTHYDYVCEQVSQGCQRVMLDHDIPVIFGILTTENEEQAESRVGGSEGHKGKDAANAAIEMATIVHELSKTHKHSTISA